MKGRMTALLLLICTACLWAEVKSTSMKYELWVRRDVENTLTGVYFTDVTGAPLGDGSYLSVDLEKTLGDIQFMVAVENNLTSSSSNVTISLTLGRFTMQNAYNKNDKFRGGYALAVWKYEPVTIPVDVDGETENWTFQAQPSTTYQSNAFSGQTNGNGITLSAGDVRLRSSYEDAKHVTTNNNGNDGSQPTVTWTADKTDHPMGESRIWYYGVGIQTTGTTAAFGNLTDLRSFPPGGELVAPITLTVTGP